MVLGIALVMFVAIEVFFSLGFYIRGFWHPPAADFRILADTYSDSEWASKYYKEIEEIEKGRTLRWQSYVYWRRTRCGDWDPKMLPPFPPSSLKRLKIKE
jgi:hypothetical protein